MKRIFLKTTSNMLIPCMVCIGLLVLFYVLGIVENVWAFLTGYLIGWLASLVFIIIYEYSRFKKMADKTGFTVDEVAWACYELGWHISCVERDAYYLRKKLLNR